MIGKDSLEWVGDSFLWPDEDVECLLLSGGCKYISGYLSALSGARCFVVITHKTHSHTPAAVSEDVPSAPRSRPLEPFLASLRAEGDRQAETDRSVTFFIVTDVGPVELGCYFVLIAG